MKQVEAVHVGCLMCMYDTRGQEFYILYKLMSTISVPNVLFLYMSSKGQLEKWNQEGTQALLCL